MQDPPCYAAPMAEDAREAPGREAPGLPARRAAAQAVEFVLSRRGRLEDGLDQARGFTAMAPRDRAFARLLAASVIRRLNEIDALLDQFLERKPPPAAMAILRVAAAEMLALNAPPHAAVSSAVALAGTDRKTAKLKGLVNAVLRRVAERIAAGAPDFPAEDNLPGWLRESWIKAYGRQTARTMAQASAGEPPLDLTARADPQAVAAMTSGTLLPSGAVRLTGGGRIEDIPGFAEGAWWVQDAASAAPARLLAARPGERVFDLCAAPGGKALQLAAAGAQVTAVDVSEQRLRRLRRNMERTGLAMDVVAADVLDWAPPAPADAVLLDAPCSATGTLRRSPEAAWLRGPKDVAALTELQRSLLARAADLVRPGGRLVYCVCSLQPEEGEIQIAAFLCDRPDLRILPVAPEELPGLEQAVRDDGTVRILPSFWAEYGGIDGFYAARLEKAPFTLGSNDRA